MKPVPLDRRFLGNPIAHRALHDIRDGRPENSRAAMRAAIARGYGIEIDLQISTDGQAMVFHDYDMGRLAGVKGPIRNRSAREIEAIPLLHGDGETVPGLDEVLGLINGQVPLLIEIKDQDGARGPNVGPLEKVTADALQRYDGPVAVMSFNPYSMIAMATYAPQISRGLTTCAYLAEDFPVLSAETRARLSEIPDYEAVGASFISHDIHDLENPRVHELQAGGADVLCWTVKSLEAEEKARRVAQNVTFEGYISPMVA